MPLQCHFQVHLNRPVIAELMNVPFEMRINDILTDSMPIRDIIKKYPFLKDKYEVNYGDDYYY